MTIFVAGFLLDDQGRVVLIHKNRPDYLAGMWNAVGGGIEPIDSNYQAAMQREFEEETGVTVPRMKWDFVLDLHSNGNSISFYRSWADPEVLDSVKTMTDETVAVHRISEVLDPYPVIQVVPNLRWILPYVVYKHDLYYPPFIMEREPEGRE